MVSFTPKYSLPYVVGVDYVANYPNTVSKPLAERVESQLEATENALTSLESSAASKGDLDAINSTLEDLGIFKIQMTQAVQLLYDDLLELSETKTDTIYSDYSATQTEYFTVTRVGRVVTVEGSVKSTIDVETSNAYIDAIRLPAWAIPPADRDNMVFATEVNTWDTNEYSISYGRINSYNLRLVGPFNKGDVVRGNVTFLTEAAMDAGTTDTGGEQ